ncbi:acylphosphatase [Rathayibacter soli]|uniref:acylphosphatase n=1 Tax=Rathayibacter soli TaxID=3144168 RepID=UPI0027E3C91E|nr:acylphosphatase [Glaciibacter superstes]
MIRRRVLVHGRVQGVGFRYSCAIEAQAHNVGGWVRNRPDGAVEALFEGAETDVAALVEWMRTGPPWAHVRAVEVVEEGADEGAADGAVTIDFEIRG